MSVTKPITLAVINKALAAKYGKGQFILARGSSYYYFRGEDDRSFRVTSLFAWTPGECKSVADVVDHVESEIQKL